MNRPCNTSTDGQTFFETNWTGGDYIKKKTKVQIEQYNKKEKNTQTQHQASQQTYHTTQMHPKHEDKNPDNAHHLVLTNSTTQTSAAA